MTFHFASYASRKSFVEAMKNSNRVVVSRSENSVSVISIVELANGCDGTVLVAGPMSQYK